MLLAKGAEGGKGDEGLEGTVELAVDVGGDGQPSGLRAVIWSTPKRAPGAFFLWTKPH